MTQEEQYLATLVRRLARVRDEDLVELARTPAALALREAVVSTPRRAPRARQAGRSRVAVARRAAAPLGHRTWRLGLVAAGVLLAAALLVGLPLLQPERGQAAWATVPDPVAPVQEVLAREACAADALVHGVDTLPDLVIVDLRGRRAYATFSDDGLLVGCLLDVADDRWSGTVVQVAERTSPDGVLSPDSVMTFEADGTISHVSGEVSDAVTAVVVRIPGLGEARASMAHGRFSIWWPGDVRGVTVSALDAGGSPLTSIDLEDMT